MMKLLHIDSSLWFDKDEKGFLGKGRIELLKNIDTYGSLSKAAKSMNMSYKAAWDSLNEMKKISNIPLVTTSTGGSGGGGSRLTNRAKEYIKMYDLLHKSQQEFLKSIELHTDNFSDLQTFLQRNSLRTSARNQLFGKVIKIQKSSINSKITIQIDEAIKIVSSITNQSIKQLGIKNNSNIFVLIKAPWLKISTQKIDEENQLETTVKKIKKENDLVEITLQTNSNLMLISVMTLDKFQTLGIKQSDKVIASFKPKDTIIGV
ncbi:MAG: LysR family transcriptional regulator [Epsilonproteobacteria bacterium]|nr:LysR family transcriptional regulator [Campylobacterota bacterium]